MSYKELLEENGLDWTASDEDILAIDDVGPVTLEKIRAAEPKDTKYVSTKNLLTFYKGGRLYLKPGDEIPADAEIIDRLLDNGSAREV